MGDNMPLLHWKIIWGYILPRYLQGSADIEFDKKRLNDKIGQWVEALYKIWNVVS